MTYTNARNLEGQVQPFWLDTTDGEKLFCWHVLPLDVYLENEYELVNAAREGEVAEELKDTLGEKLIRRDSKSRVVVNFHGVSSFFTILTSCSIYLLAFLWPYFHFTTQSSLEFSSSLFS